MQTTATSKAHYDIPIQYNCSKCGRLVYAHLPVESTGQATSHGILNEYAKDALKLRASGYAREHLIQFIRNRYKNGPMHYREEIMGKCSYCGNQEVWQNNPKKKVKRNSLIDVLLSLLPMAALIGSVYLGFASGTFLVGVLVFILFIFAIIKVPIWVCMLLQKKEQKGLPSKYISQANAPQFVLPLEEVLLQITTGNEK